MLVQQFAELCQPTLFVGPEMKMDMPAQVILSERVIIFRPLTDDMVERVEAKILCVAQVPSKRLVFDAPAERPDRIDKRKPRQLHPRRAEVPDFVPVRGPQKIERGIADEERKVRHGLGLVTGQRL